MSLRAKDKDAEFGRVRATPLKPIVWMTSVLAWASVVALAARVSKWAGIFLCGLTGISFLTFLISYIYLFMNDRDALRAEKWRKHPATIDEETAHQRTELNTHPPAYFSPDRAATTVASFGVGAGEEKVSSGQTTRMTEEQ